MKKEKQFSFLNSEPIPKRFFGGALLHGRRKGLRPLSRKDSVHFVLRSEWAMGRDSFLAKRNYASIQYIIKRFAKKFGVRIYQQSINSNHLHLLLRITNRALYKAFIKAISGQIASHVMGQQSFKLFAESRRQGAAGDGSSSMNEAMGNANNAKKTTNAANNIPLPTVNKIKQGFWQFRPFSRLVNWGRDFKICTSYLKQNILEAFGFVKYKHRKNHYSTWIKQSAPDLNTG